MAKTSSKPAAPATVVATVAVPAPAGAPAGLHGGIPLEQLPANIRARGAGVGKTTDSTLAMPVKLGTVACKVRAAHCVAWWQATEKALAGGKTVTVGDLAKLSVPPHFTTYAIRNNWLAKVTPAK